MIRSRARVLFISALIFSLMVLTYLWAFTDHQGNDQSAYKKPLFLQQKNTRTAFKESKKTNRNVKKNLHTKLAAKMSKENGFRQTKNGGIILDNKGLSFLQQKARTALTESTKTNRNVRGTPQTKLAAEMSTENGFRQTQNGGITDDNKGLSFLQQKTRTAFIESTKTNRNVRETPQTKLAAEMSTENSFRQTPKNGEITDEVTATEPSATLQTKTAVSVKITKPQDLTINHKTAKRNTSHASNDLIYKSLDGTFEKNFAVIDYSEYSFPTRLNNAPFILVIPRILKMENNKKWIKERDQRAAMTAGSLLNSLGDFDGIACLPQKLNRENPQNPKSFKFREEWNGLFNSTWCNFLKREWSIQIRNSGKIKKFHFSNKRLSMIQLCNLVNGPFVIRREKFKNLNGFNARLGRLALLDFFVRSQGRFKIGKTSDCFFNDDLFKNDRGRLEGTGDFPEYSNFGSVHNVLRIIMEDRIEWTKCVATHKLCKEEPYKGPPTTLPEIAQPICCNVILGQILKDIVEVMTKRGIQYRVIFGTLLGGERSESIIPYTRDVDFTLDKKYAQNKESYATLQKYFGNKYFISGHSFIDFPRLISLMPAHLNITTGRFFKNEYDLEGDRFFSEAVNKSVEDFLPFESTEWNTRPYADFYKVQDNFWDGSSTTVINGETYDTIKIKHEMLDKWYGSGWKTPALNRYHSHSDQGQAPDKK